jgi:hypothetical protein
VPLFPEEGISRSPKTLYYIGVEGELLVKISLAEGIFPWATIAVLITLLFRYIALPTS